MQSKYKTLLVLTLLLVLAGIVWLLGRPSPSESLPILSNTPWERYVGFNLADRLSYGFSSLIGLHNDYSWAVLTSYTIIMLCCVGVIILLAVMAYDVYRRRKAQARYNSMEQRYADALRRIATTDDYRLVEAEIEQMLSLSADSRWNYAEKLCWIDLLIAIRLETGTTASGLKNLQLVIRRANLVEFMENRLLNGRDRDKLRIIQAVRLLEMEMPDSVMSRLVNHRNSELRKAARFYYMLVNRDDPYRFFEKDQVGADFLHWDRLELHQLFSECAALDKRLPSFIPLMERSSNSQLIAFLIEETAYWSSDEEVHHLISYFQHPQPECREAAFKAMGIRRFAEAEESLKEAFYTQTEEQRRTIMHSLLQINSGNSLDFFTDVARQSASELTRTTALFCLWQSGTAGRQRFTLLRNESSPTDSILFEHVTSSAFHIP